MRNLKRALSLAVAAAMLISLMVVGASAADYGDTAEITQTEAVEVLTGLGIVGGDENGDFNPSATLTRAEFCVMMANVLTGGNFDASLFDGTSTPFTDVAGHWGAAYIAYCYSNGIVAGTSTTTFEPDSTLTAAQASAILLMTLGYNQNNEFAANSQFELNVTRWAQQAGLYDGLSVSATAGISRDNTAQLIFNALTNTTPVGYSSLAESYYTVGESALSGVVYSGSQLDPKVPNSGDLTDAQTRYTYTLGYTNFTLKQTESDTTDAFGRPAVSWVYGTSRTEIGAYADDAEGTYTTEVTYEDLYDLLGSTVVNKLFDDSDPTTVTVKIDSNDPTSDDFDLGGDSASDLRSNDDGLALEDGTEFTGDGITTEVYLDDEDNITLVVVNNYLAVVDADYDEEEESVEITIYGNDDADSATLELDDFAGIVSYLEDDRLVVTVADGEVQSAYAATVVEDVAVTSYSSSSVTADGTRYTLNDAATELLSTYTVDDADVTITLYLDANGYVMGTEEYEGSSLGNYVFISAYEANSSVVDNTSGYTARAYFTDGSVEVIDVRNAGIVAEDTEDGGWSDDDPDHDTWYRYSQNSSGRYTLTEATSTPGTATEVNSSNVTLATGVRANSSTVFLFVDTDDMEVTSTATGIRNVDFTVASGSSIIALVDDGYALAVIVYDGDSATTSGDYIYILGGSSAVAGEDKVSAKSTSYDSDNDVTYYTYDAIVNGEKTTVDALSNTELTVGLYDARYEYNGLYLTDTIENYLVTESNYDADEVAFVSTAGDASYSSGTLVLNSDATYVLADDYSLLTAAGKTVTERTTSRLVNLLNDADGDFYGSGAIVLLNDDGEATCVIVSQAIVVEDEELDDTADADDINTALESRNVTITEDYEVEDTITVPAGRTLTIEGTLTVDDAADLDIEGTLVAEKIDASSDSAITDDEVAALLECTDDLEIDGVTLTGDMTVAEGKALTFHDDVVAGDYKFEGGGTLNVESGATIDKTEAVSTLVTLNADTTEIDLPDPNVVFGTHVGNVGTESEGDLEFDIAGTLDGAAIYQFDFSDLDWTSSSTVSVSRVSADDEGTTLALENASDLTAHFTEDNDTLYITFDVDGEGTTEAITFTVTYNG